jgi:hypothetical protein
VLYTGNIVYLTATEKEITFHISSCNINYESNIEFKDYLISNNLYRPGKYYNKKLVQLFYHKFVGTSHHSPSRNGTFVPAEKKKKYMKEYIIAIKQTKFLWRRL